MNGTTLLSERSAFQAMPIHNPSATHFPPSGKTSGEERQKSAESGVRLGFPHIFTCFLFVPSSRGSKFRCVSRVAENLPSCFFGFVYSHLGVIISLPMQKKNKCTPMALLFDHR